jgi:hypothetical protein
VVDALLAALEEPNVEGRAASALARARAAGLRSDWEGCAKELDFGRLVFAARKVLGAGSSVETGVFEGGTSALLILSATPETFHVSVDPYGLPGQSYPLEEYRRWESFRKTTRRLAELADDCGVTYAHYLTDSRSFVEADLLPPASFNIVHLDGDHGYETVGAELSYFGRKLVPPVLFILDDHDDHYPGVGQALGDFPDLERVFHRMYDFPNYGWAGFSAWVSSGR